MLIVLVDINNLKMLYENIQERQIIQHEEIPGQIFSFPYNSVFKFESSDIKIEN